MNSTEISICTDCLMLLANGTVGDDYFDNLPEDDATENATTRHAAKIEHLWPDTPIVPHGDDFEGFFSWNACEGCGGTLGGDRHLAIAFDIFADDVNA